MSEILPNGMVLPHIWPPRDRDPADDAPMPVPWLSAPPTLIFIDCGRQLFVDDFLIDHSDLSRVFHQPVPHPANPVLRPSADVRRGSVHCGNGGIWYDPDADRFRLYHSRGWHGPLAVATSRDLMHWEEIEPLSTERIDDHAIWRDARAPAAARYKRLELHRKRDRAGYVHCWSQSPDGRTWTDERPAGPPGSAGDYCSFYHDPFRQRWVASIRTGGEAFRMRAYQDSRDFAGSDWSQQVHWTRADRLDQPEPHDGYHAEGDPCQLYALNAVAYESLMVGVHAIHRGPANAHCLQQGIPKLTDLELGFSRDGFHWHRPDRGGFLRCARQAGSWDRGYLHSTAGLFVVHADRLVFPYTGFSGRSPDGTIGSECGGAIGFVSLRRDGFASMDANQQTGTLTTRLVTFTGTRLFVNLHAAQGHLRVAVLDEHSHEIAPFTLASCMPVSGDHTLAAVRWQGGDDLSPLCGRPVRLRFTLTNGALYSFWVSRDASGRSDGYVAAGGPGFTNSTDTVGRMP